MKDNLTAASLMVFIRAAIRAVFSEKPSRVRSSSKEDTQIFRSITTSISSPDPRKLQKDKPLPEVNILFKELQRTLPADNPDGSRTGNSGQGCSPGALNGATSPSRTPSVMRPRADALVIILTTAEPGAYREVPSRQRMRVLPLARREKDGVWMQYLWLLNRQRISVRFH